MDHGSSPAAMAMAMATEADWASLEMGILEQIARHLPDDADRVRVGHVCRRWRSAVSGDRAVMGRPWMLARRRRRGLPFWRSHAFLRLSSSLRDVGALRAAGAMAIPPFANVVGFTHGWLAVVKRADRVVLTDPTFPGAVIALPPFLPGYHVRKVFLSGDPSTTPEWTVFAIAAAAAAPALPHGHHDALASCRRGDASWTRVIDDDYPARRYSSLEFHRGFVYAADDYSSKLISVHGAAVVSRSWMPIRSYQPVGKRRTMEWPVECAGDLLLVQLELRYAPGPHRRRCVVVDGGWTCTRSARRHTALSFTVWKVLPDGDGRAGTYMRVRNIGDYALFVGESGHAFAVRAKRLAGVRRGFVYYAGDVEKGMVEFCMRDGRYETKPYREAPLLGTWEPFCWFCPRRPVVDEVPEHGRRSSAGDTSSSCTPR